MQRQKVNANLGVLRGDISGRRNVNGRLVSDARNVLVSFVRSLLVHIAFQRRELKNFVHE